VTGIKELSSTTGVEFLVVKLAWLLQDVAGAADALTSARSVMIVPGYGLAVAGAQYAIAGACVASIPNRPQLQTCELVQPARRSAMLTGVGKLNLRYAGPRADLVKMLTEKGIDVKYAHFARCARRHLLAGRHVLLD